MYGAVVTWTLLSANCRNNEKSKMWKKRFESKSQKFVPCQSRACRVPAAWRKKNCLFCPVSFMTTILFLWERWRTTRKNPHSCFFIFEEQGRRERTILNKRRDSNRNSLIQQSRAWGKEEPRTGGIAQMSSDSDRNSLIQQSRAWGKGGTTHGRNSPDEL